MRSNDGSSCKVRGLEVDATLDRSSVRWVFAGEPLCSSATAGAPRVAAALFGVNPRESVRRKRKGTHCERDKLSFPHAGEVAERLKAAVC